MKNMMRRTVAFMLMACLFLSVMAPAASAVAVNEPDATTGAISYSWANTVAGTSMGEVSVGTEYGNFEYLAAHGRVKGSQTVLQTQSTFSQGSFFTLKFTVANAGYYDIALDIAEAKTSTTEIDVHFFPVSAMNAEMSKTDRETAVATNETPYHVEVADTAARTLSRVNFAAAGDYVLVVERTSETGVNMNFKGFTMTDVSDEVAKEQAFIPALVEDSYVYTWTATADDRTANNYPTNYTGYFGNFAGYANSGSTMYKPYDGYMQIQSARTSGYIALRFNVPAAGTYNISYDVSGGAKVIDVFFVDPANMATGNGVTANTTYVDGLTGGQRITVGSDVETVTKVALTAGDHVMVWRLDSTSATGNVNFGGMTLSPYVAPDVATTTTTYDFTNLGALYGASAGGHAYFIPTDIDGNEVLDRYQELYDAGKINYMPYAERPSESGGDVYAENGQYNYGLFGQFTGKSGLFAVKIDNPGVGTYNFATAITTGYANATAQGQVYVIPVSDVEAVMTASQVTASDAIFNLIQGDYAGKHITEGSFRSSDSLTGTVEIESAEDHVVVFYAASIRSGNGTQAWMHVKNFTLSNSYNDINAALAASGSKFDTVALLDNIDLDNADLTVSTGAVLDLNGFNLDATVNVTNGSLEDSSNGAGSVSGVTNVTKDNGSVLIKDGDTVRAYNYTAKQNGYKASETKENVYEFWFDADFAADAYAKLTAANGVSISAELKLNNKVVAIISLEDKVAQWVAQDGSEDYALGVEITGMETLKEGDTVTVTPKFTDSYGTSAVFGDAIVYTAPAAAE